MSFDSKERAWEDSQLDVELSRENDAEDDAAEVEQEVQDMLAAPFTDIRDEVLIMFFENLAQENFFACKTSDELIDEFQAQIDAALYSCAEARIAKRNAALRAENTCPISIPRRPVGLHRTIADGAERMRRKMQADEIARPMREMFALLATGEVFEVDGVAVMSMPELDPSLRQSSTDWVDIAAAAEGWIDLWSRIAPKLRQDKLKTLAERLRTGKDLTPRLIEIAKAQFEDAVTMIPDIPPGAIASAIRTTQIAWEIERGVRPEGVRNEQT